MNQFAKIDDIDEMRQAAKSTGTMSQFNTFMKSNSLKCNDNWVCGYDNYQSNPEQMEMKRRIRTMIVQNIDKIKHELVYQNFTSKNICKQHQIQLCFYENGKIKILHHLNEPNRAGLIFRFTEDQTFEYRWIENGESRFLDYFERMLAHWYGHDDKEKLIKAFDLNTNINTYAKNDMIDKIQTKDSITNKIKRLLSE